MKIIISDEELKGRMKLPLPSLLENGELKLPDIIVPKDLGRPEGAENKDGLTKELVALDSAFGNLSQKEIARIHNVAQSEVSYLGKGFDRSNVDTRKVDEEVSTSLFQTKNKILDRATAKLLETIDNFEPTALDHKQMPDAAVKMALVMEKMEGKFGSSGSANSVQFHIYAPRTRHEDQYEVIQVNE